MTDKKKIEKLLDHLEKHCWYVERYIVNSDGERIKVIIANEDNLLLLSMTEFENHFAQANKPLTEQEWLQTATTEQLADFSQKCKQTNTKHLLTWHILTYGNHG